MMVMNDGGNISGVAWNDEGITDDFDNMGSMSTQFNAIRNEWGEHDCITEDTGTTVTFTTDDEPVLLTFDTQTNNFVPVVGELTDGTPNMFTRTLNDGTSDVTIVCDADGKLCVIDGTHYIQKSAQDEFSLMNDDTKLLALTTAAGGTVAVTATESSDTDMTKITNGNYFFVFNQDGYVTFGEITAFHPADWLYAVPHIVDNETKYYIGNAEGKCYLFKYGVSSQVAIEVGVTNNEVEFIQEISSPGGSESDFVDKQVNYNEGLYYVDNYGKEYIINPYEFGGEPWLSPMEILVYNE